MSDIANAINALKEDSLFTFLSPDGFFIYYDQKNQFFAIHHHRGRKLLTKTEFLDFVEAIIEEYARDETIRYINGQSKDSQKSRIPLKQKESSRAGYVYLFGQGNNQFKIGQSRTPRKRARQLNAGNPRDLKIIHTIKTNDMDALETALHHRFENKKIAGEWFKLNENDVEYIKGLKQ